MSSNPCNDMDYGGGYHQTADQGGVGLWLVSRRSVCGRRLNLRPIGCRPTSAVCDIDSAAAITFFNLVRLFSDPAFKQSPPPRLPKEQRRAARR